MPVVYLIPTLLHDEGLFAIAPYIKEAIRDCQVFFVENERSARRFMKKIMPEIVIDEYEWVEMADRSNVSDALKTSDTIKAADTLKAGKNIGILSEAGCPGVADPGQNIVAIAQKMDVQVKPLVGPNSILLALMASGMNGQQFRFLGYLPIDKLQREKAIRELEAESKTKNCTQIFIETPYRNNQMLEAVMKCCGPSTLLCIAMDLTGKNEWIKTKSTSQWKNDIPDLHKRPVIFLIYSGIQIS